MSPETAAAASQPAGGTGWDPDGASLRFTLAVMPDTQYLFDQDRGSAAPLDASLRWVLDHAQSENVVFLAHLGDLTQNGLAGEFERIGRSFGALGAAGADYSVLAGNHDIRSSTDDQRRHAVPAGVRAPAVRRPGLVRRGQPGRLQHLPRVPRWWSTVAAACA